MERRNVRADQWASTENVANPSIFVKLSEVVPDLRSPTNVLVIRLQAASPHNPKLLIEVAVLIGKTPRPRQRLFDQIPLRLAFLGVPLLDHFARLTTEHRLFLRRHRRFFE